MRSGIVRSVIAWTCAILSLLFVGRNTSAAETAADVIEPQISLLQYQKLIESIHPTKQQRDITEILFEEYRENLTSLAEVTDRRAIAAGRDTIDRALSGRQRVEIDELRKLRLDVLDIYEQAWPEADRLLKQLLQDVGDFLNDRQRTKWLEAKRVLRKALYLSPRREAEFSQEYAGDGLDLTGQINNLRRETADLADALAADTDAGKNLSSVLFEYEKQLDSMLVSTYSAFRHCRLEKRRARIRRNPEAVLAEQKARLEVWQPLYELNQKTARRIDSILTESISGEVAALWRQRFDEATFPWLYQRELPDRQYQWLLKQSLDEKQRKQIEEIYSSYQTRHRELAGRATNLMIRGRLELRTIFHAMMTPINTDDDKRRELYEQILKNSGEIQTLMTRTSNRFEELLDDEQRLKMRRAVGRR